MNTGNLLAVIGLLSIVISLYALKHGHTRYLLDLVMASLALVAPQQSAMIGAVIILSMIRHSRIARGMAEFLPGWLLPIALPAARDMSITIIDALPLEEAYKRAISGDDQDDGNEEEPQPVAEKDDENIIAGKVSLAANAILSGAMGLTEATRLVAGSQGGRKYTKAGRMIKAEISRIENHYADLDSAKRQVVKKSQ